MPLNPGYSYLVIDSYTLPINPTRCEPFTANKDVITIKTQTKTVVQQWDSDATDRYAHYEWDNITTAAKDTLLSKYLASYTEYDFYDEYGTHHKVVIEKIDSPKRRGYLDSDGWVLTMDLRKTG